MNKKVAGVFERKEQAIHAIEQLKAEGYAMNDIFFMTKDTDDLTKIAEETGAPVAKKSDSIAAVGALSGAMTGAAVAGTYGLFTGMGAQAVLGLGPGQAVGGIINAWRNSAAGLASGGILGTLIGMGISSKDAIQYEKYVRTGKILVLIETETDKNSEHLIDDIFTANESLISEMKKIQEKAKDALVDKHNKINREEFLEGLR